MLDFTIYALLTWCNCCAVVLQMMVDLARRHNLNVHVDVSFPAIPCAGTCKSQLVLRAPKQPAETPCRNAAVAVQVVACPLPATTQPCASTPCQQLLVLSCKQQMWPRVV
jgi:hypothetical protein